jgi:hypothetical protein
MCRLGSMYFKPLQTLGQTTMHYPDLSPYCYNLNQPLLTVLNVGWLNRDHPYNEGTPIPEFTEKMISIFLSRGPFNAEIGLMRSGSHECEICGEMEILVRQGLVQRPLGISQIWIPGRAGRLYASPSMLIHYVQEHRYLPPQEYIDSVLAVDLSLPFRAEAVWFEMLTGRRL